MLVAQSAIGAGPAPDLAAPRGEEQGTGFSQVLEPREFEFPRDHGPHPGFRQEWWYLTGHLFTAVNIGSGANFYSTQNVGVGSYCHGDLLATGMVRRVY